MEALSLANPGRFFRIAGRVRPVLPFVFVPILAIGLYLGLFIAPPDYLQGESVRIMFVHVPSAWSSLGIYLAAAASALGVLVRGHVLAGVALRAALLPGAAFTFIALASGALWGRPTWGTYWVWDARLTSMLILLFVYLGLAAFSRALEESGRGPRALAIATLFGAVNLPIVKFSVDWWNTLHQPASVLRSGGPSIHPSMLMPLLLVALGCLILFVWLHAGAMQNEILRRRIAGLRQRRTMQAHPDSVDTDR